MNKSKKSNNENNRIIKCLNKLIHKTLSFNETEYFPSYFEFLTYFENLTTIDKHSLTIGSYFTYGWMPTILKNFNKGQTLDEAVEILNKVKSNDEIEDLQYLILVRCINNSIVGTSKLLHFINPTNYPIFDSRIKRFFEMNNLTVSVYNPKVPNIERGIKQYQTYRNICLEIIKNPLFEDIHKEALLKHDFPKYIASEKNRITKMRMLESLFFYFGKN